MSEQHVFIVALAAMAVLALAVVMAACYAIVRGVLAHLENTQVVGNINSVGVIKKQTDANIEMTHARMQDAREHRELMRDMGGEPSEIGQAME